MYFEDLRTRALVPQDKPDIDLLRLASSQIPGDLQAQVNGTVSEVGRPMNGATSRAAFSVIWKFAQVGARDDSEPLAELPDRPSRADLIAAVHYAKKYVSGITEDPA